MKNVFVFVRDGLYWEDVTPECNGLVFTSNLNKAYHTHSQDGVFDLMNHFFKCGLFDIKPLEVPSFCCCYGKSKKGEYSKIIGKKPNKAH